MAHIDGLTPAAKIKFEALPEGQQLLYSSNVCAMCGASLSKKQLNKNIEEGVPPVCTRDYKKVGEAVEKLAPLLGQLQLF